MGLVTMEESPPEVRPPIVPGTDWVVRRLDAPLRWMWGRGFRFLFVIDAIGLYAAMVVINTVRFGFSWPDYPLSHYWIGFAIATAIHLTINYFGGLYEREPRLGVRPWLSRCLLAMAIGVAVQGLAFVLLDRYLMPRLNLGAFLVLGTLVLVANRRLSRFLAVHREAPPRVVLTGPDEEVHRAAAHLTDSDRDALVVGTASDPADLAGVVARSRATDVLLLDVTAFGAVFPEPLSSLEARGVGFLQRVSARETLLGLQAVRQVAGMPFVRLRAHTMPSHKARLKRVFDVLVVVVTAPLWLLVFGALAAYVLLRAGRPILYHQERLGLDGHVFRVVKFRTMVCDAERAGPVLAAKGDPRVVRGLGWLRETRADELPQLLNVIRGDMSLVGPRPERPELVEAIVSTVPGYVRRLELRPGVTGLAQVNGRYATDAEYKLGYDIQYLVNWSLVLDLQILARTVWVVLSRRL
ncbi:MAG: exopolysaccharide biosynthesis polyprenyl glycosylphosphotransferase [Ilumatobacteraceae bacterium]